MGDLVRLWITSGDLDNAELVDMKPALLGKRGSHQPPLFAIAMIDLAVSPARGD